MGRLNKRGKGLVRLVLVVLVTAGVIATGIPVLADTEGINSVDWHPGFAGDDLIIDQAGIGEACMPISPFIDYDENMVDDMNQTNQWIIASDPENSEYLYTYTLTPMEDPSYNLLSMDFIQYVLSEEGSTYVEEAGFLPVSYGLGENYIWDSTFGKWTWDPAISGPPALNPPLYYEIRVDGGCNISDSVLMGKVWGDTGTRGWIPEDIYADGGINVSDSIWLGRNWGNYWPHS